MGGGAIYFGFNTFSIKASAFDLTIVLIESNLPIRLAQVRLIPWDSYVYAFLRKSLYRQWLPRSVHDGPRCRADLVTALATFKHAGPGLKTPRITHLTTGRAFEPFWPPDTLQMPSTGSLIREERLKLQQSPGVSDMRRI